MAHTSPRGSKIINWRRNLYILFVVQLLSTAGFSLIFPFLPLFVRELGVATTVGIVFWAGMVFSAQAFTITVFSPVLGGVADRGGRMLMLEGARWGAAGLGWLVLPEALVAAVERLAQNLFICASTIAQHAALACFEPESIAEYERRRSEFRARRDLVVPSLHRLGLRVPVMPDGAFYAYADCRQHASSSWDFCFDLMHRAHVALTPGRDFGRHEPEAWLRLSFATSTAKLEEALHRLKRELA